MVKWLKRLALTSLCLIVAGILVRILAPLPPLEERPHSSALAYTDETPLGQWLAPAARKNAGLSGIFALSRGPEAFAARVLMTRAATRSIDAQYYIWDDDLTGTLLFEELRGAADRGVRVRLLLDDNSTGGLDPIIAALNDHPRIQVRLFNPFPLRGSRVIGYATDFFRLNRRMHNKSFTVDNQAAILGGRNIGDEYFGALQDAFYIDLDVLAVGWVVPEISQDFDRYWASASSYPADRLVEGAGYDTAKLAGERLDAARRTPQAASYLQSLLQLPLARQFVERRVPFEWVPARLVSDDPAKALGRAVPQGLLFPALVTSMGEPVDEFGLASGYFVPAEVGTDSLVRMAKRGVTVTVLTNSLAATDVAIVHAGYAKRRKELLRSGVRIFELRGSDAVSEPRARAAGSGMSAQIGGGSALHAKTMVSDGSRVFVGSFNFDPRSANLNTELGLVIESEPLARRIQTAIERSAPAQSFEVRIAPEGSLYWIERRSGSEVRHDTEPGTTFWQRLAVSFLSLFPIEWLL